MNPTPKALIPLEHAARTLGEHFDSANVAVFVSWMEDGKTKHGEYMVGNAFALQNHIAQWVAAGLYTHDDEELPE